MITAGLICAALLSVVGLSDGSKVTQTPLLWRDEGQSATMNCSHTMGSSYFQMYWCSAVCLKCSGSSKGMTPPTSPNPETEV
ncbi:hypothetical protein Q5P01_020867 [Channa striata]|uniref:Uncharacterized protein n=1 Tax=Channa striata TaxID=64152 RepID=A0AA88LYC2_CHASR|nr:hypothetical protein Q5P01_020867 [Channa striata]